MAKWARSLAAGLTVMVLGVSGLGGGTVQGAGAFADAAQHWAAASITDASGRGIVTGYPDGTFRPNGSLTRAAFVTMLVRTLGLPPIPEDRLPYGDVQGHWVASGGWLGAANVAGLILPSDYPDGRFGPDAEITREEIAVMVTRAVYPGADAAFLPQNPFTDAGSITGWRLPYVAEAARLGLITGYPDSTFRPENRATRAEAVVIALRVAARPPQASQPQGPVQPGEGGSFRPKMPVEAPPDALRTWQVGQVAISSHTPVTWMLDMDTRNNLFFILENKGSTPVTLTFESLSDLRGAAKPTWLYAVLGYGDLYGGSIKLAPGESQQFELILSAMMQWEEYRETVPFRFKLQETGEVVTLPLEFIVKPGARLREMERTAVVTGRVVDQNGAPVAGANVTLYFIHGGNGLRTTTDATGRYRIEAPPMLDLKTILGSRPRASNTDGYTVIVDKLGYDAWFKAGVSPAAGQQMALDVRLQAAKAPASFRLVDEIVTEGRYGYWWTKFLGATDRAVTVQGQHPPRLDLPGHLLGLDMQGRELWRIPTGNECWALDTSADGAMVAAGCHDGKVYVADASGKLLWQKSLGKGMSPEVYTVRFSPNGSQLVVDRGPSGDSFGVYQAATGDLVWAPEQSLGQMRAARWSSDGKRLVTTHNSGDVRMWTAGGRPLWVSWIGEVPFELEMDLNYHVYGGGKAQYIYSLDGDTGAVRWRRYMDSTPNEGVRHMTAKGDLLLVDSFNGMLYAMEPSTGKSLWERQLPAIGEDAPHGTGHNALDMTPDGSLIAVGTRDYQVLVYDRNGALLWSHKAGQRPDFVGDPASHGHYTGALSIAISPDGTHIVAGYADSVVRVFQRER